MDKQVFTNNYQKNGVQIHEIVRQFGKTNFHSVVLMDGDVAFEMEKCTSLEEAKTLFADTSYFNEY